MEGRAQVNGVELWYQVTGEGEPVVQIHGAGFGHFNFAPATPALAEHFRVIDYDLRGYGQSDRPVQDYDMEVWADDVAGLLDALGIDQAHVHGTSMGGMIAIVFAGKYPERTTSVVINCAAAKLGMAGRLVFKNWIDIARMDPDGPGSRILAELIAWQALSKAFLETPDGVAAIDTIQQILRDSNRIEVFTAACQAMCDMDIRDWLPKITSPALVLGGDEDLMTPWDQGPDGAGQEAIYEGIPGAEKHVIRGSNHSTIFDNTDEHVRVVIDFFRRHAAHRLGRARSRGLRRRADPGRAADGRAGATCSRSTSPSSSTRSCTCSGRSRSSTAGCRSAGRSLAIVARAGARVRPVDPVRTARRRLRAPGAGGDAGDARLLGRAPLSSPFRMIAATYWFAAQALAGALGIQAIVVALGGDKPPLVPVALALAAFHAALAVLGFDVMRYVLRVVLPVSLAFTAVLLALYLPPTTRASTSAASSTRPTSTPRGLGFATVVTVMCGASLTLVTSIADFCRYTPTRRDIRIGLFASALPRPCWSPPSWAATPPPPPVRRTPSSPSPT